MIKNWTSQSYFCPSLYAGGSTRKIIKNLKNGVNSLKISISIRGLVDEFLQYKTRRLYPSRIIVQHINFCLFWSDKSLCPLGGIFGYLLELNSERNNAVIWFISTNLVINFVFFYTVRCVYKDPE